MNLESKGWVREARRVESPNQDDRPPGTGIEVLVIHAISLPPGEFGGEWIERLFCNRLPPDAHPYFARICELKVSAHFLVRRGGELLQFVSLHRRAWHAGASSFRGREAVNDFSVGVELEGCDDRPFGDAQYETLSRLTRTLMKHCPAIAPGNIVGHSDIAPGRKTDPGPCFDWKRYLASLETRCRRRQASP